jgi:hypothetical protein
MKRFKYGITLIIACLNITSIHPQNNIFKAIRSNDSTFFEKIQPGDIRVLTYEKETGYAPLHVAVLLDDEAEALHFVQLLIGKGAIINQPNAKDGKTALHYVVDQQDSILAYYLLTQDADPKIENQQGLNVFQYACTCNQSSMARFILFFYKKRLQQYVNMPREIIDFLYRTIAAQIQEKQAINQHEKAMETFDFNQFDCYQEAVQRQYTAGIRSNL